MTPEEKYELFEKFCGQELSINEKARLNKLLDEDVSVKEELKVYGQLHSYLDTTFNSEAELAMLENTLKKIGKSYFVKSPKEKSTEKPIKKEIEKETKRAPKKESRVIKIPAWIYVAAASVAIIFGVYFFSKSNPVYNDFATIPELSIAERGSADKNSKNAEHAFNAKNYLEAEKYLSILLSEDESNAEYQFYYGISLLEQDKYANASQIFERLYQGNSGYKYRALWFEALNQLKQKKYDQCSELLKNIPKEAEDYNQAQKLLKKI